MPLVSIIIPTYNPGKLLARVLDSIVMQSFQDIEVIVMDGQSEESTMNVIKEYADKNKTVKWISEKDEGVYDAMNKGIRLAKGEWLYFLGSDDKLHNNMVLENIFQNKTYDDVDVIYGNVNSERYNGMYDGEFDEEKIIVKNICHQSIFYKRSVFNKIGFYDTRFKVFADWEHNWKWFFSSKIKRLYLNLIIADYADGGYSATNIDIPFEDSKKLRIIKYAHKHLDFTRKLEWFRDELYLKRKADGVRGILNAMQYLPYVFFRF